MTEYLVFEYWKPKAGRFKELLDEFQPVLISARKYNVEMPCVYLLKDDTESEALLISCFNSEQAYSEYLGSFIHQEIRSVCESKSLLEAPTRIEVVELATGFTHRPEISEASDPLVVVASIHYEPGTRNEGVKHWSDVTKSVAELEKDTGTYCFLKSLTDENILFSFERYKSKEFFQNVHVPSEAIQTNIKCQKDIRTPGGLSHRFWKEVGNSRLPE